MPRGGDDAPDRGVDDAGAPLLNRELSLARPEPARARPRRRPDRAAARARQVLRRSSRRSSTSSSWSASPACSTRSSPGVAVRSPDGRTPQQTLAEIRERVLELTAAQSRLWRDELCPGARRRGDPASARSTTRPSEELAELERVFARQIYPGAHPARRRPGPAVPVHLRPVAQPRRHRARSRSRARSGSRASRCPKGCPLRRGRRARPADPARERDRALPDVALPGDGDRRARGVPPHPRRRHRDLRRRRRPARGGRDASCASAASAPSCASRSRARSRATMLARLEERLAVAPGQRLPGPRPARPRRRRRSSTRSTGPT